MLYFWFSYILLYLKDTFVSQRYLHMYLIDTLLPHKYFSFSKKLLCLIDTFVLHRYFCITKILLSLQDIYQSAAHTPFHTYHAFFRFPPSAFRFLLCFSLCSWLWAMLRGISLSAGRNYGLAIMRLAPNCRCINNWNENKACFLVRQAESQELHAKFEMIFRVTKTFYVLLSVELIR